MDSGFQRWLEEKGLGKYCGVFEAAGYLSAEDIQGLSEFDAQCVAEEEICMETSDASIFVASYQSCGLTNEAPVPESSPTPTDGDIPLPQHLVGTLGVPAWGAATVIAMQSLADPLSLTGPASVCRFFPSSLQAQWGECGE